MNEWKTRLDRILGQQPKKKPKRPTLDEAHAFLKDTVVPALEEVRSELEHRGRTTYLDVEPERVALTVCDEDDEEEFYYAVRARAYRRPNFAFPELGMNEDEDVDVYAEVYLREGSLGYGVMGYTREHIIRNFLYEYERCLKWQQPSRRK